MLELEMVHFKNKLTIVMDFLICSNNILKIISDAILKEYVIWGKSSIAAQLISHQIFSLSDGSI